MRSNFRRALKIDHEPWTYIEPGLLDTRACILFFDEPETALLLFLLGTLASDKESRRIFVSFLCLPNCVDF